MTPDDLEPMSADLTSLLDAEKPITAAPVGAKAKLLARLSADLFDGPGGDGGGEGSDGGAGGAAPSAPVTGGGVGASAGTGAVGATASGVVAKAVVAKLVVGASVASMAVGGAIGAGVHSAVTSPPPPPPPIVRLAPVEPPPVAVAIAELPPAPPPVVEAVLPVVEPRPAQPSVAKLSADEQLALEKSYVEQARAAMARKDVDAALDALAQHERRFPKGQLTEERLALKVMALSSAGRSIEARNVAAEFRRRFPTGLFRAAVDDASPE
ncbi:MAG: hypothetical protein Q8S33_12835 [Myxococcales bacterium]|nr:hypothetical protein [Myxococcales bacterium]MDP3501222.1 hypothetical protein [Myxococcales bacterium]